MRIKIARTDSYIPIWRGNRSLPEKERMVIDYMYMTGEQEEKYSSLSPVYKGDETKDIEIGIETHANAIWAECVTEVHGFLNDETGKEIVDPKEVQKIRGIYGLITEVVAHIKQGIPEVDSKN